jgi:hypothetical protein
MFFPSKLFHGPNVLAWNGITLLDREAGIAGGQALGFAAGKRNELAELRTEVGRRAAIAGLEPRPAREGAQGRLQERKPYAGDVVAVTVDLRDQRRVARPGGLRRGRYGDTLLIVPAAFLFNHPVGAGNQPCRPVKANRLDGLEPENACDPTRRCARFERRRAQSLRAIIRAPNASAISRSSTGARSVRTCVKSSKFSMSRVKSSSTM